MVASLMEEIKNKDAEIVFITHGYEDACADAIHAGRVRERQAVELKNALNQVAMMTRAAAMPPDARDPASAGNEAAGQLAEQMQQRLIAQLQQMQNMQRVISELTDKVELKDAVLASWTIACR